MAKKSKEDLKGFFSEKGKSEFEIKVSNQAANLMKHLDWSIEEWEKFTSWWIKNKACIGGAHVLEFLETQN